VKRLHVIDGRRRCDGPPAKALADVAAIRRTFRSCEASSALGRCWAMRPHIGSPHTVGRRTGSSLEGRPLRTDLPRGGRPGRRTIGTKRTLLVEILGLPIAARADSARPHDIVAARELLRDRLADLPSMRAFVADRAYRGLAAAERKRLVLDIKAPSPGVSGFVPIRPLYTRSSTPSPSSAAGAALSRCYEGTTATARAWLEVASVGYLAWRAAA
jgi:hypothetical protein